MADDITPIGKFNVKIKDSTGTVGELGIDDDGFCKLVTTGGLDFEVVKIDGRLLWKANDKYLGVGGGRNLVGDWVKLHDASTDGVVWTKTSENHLARNGGQREGDFLSRENSSSTHPDAITVGTFGNREVVKVVE